jgi:glycine cleavage system transcriptional repressor
MEKQMVLAVLTKDRPGVIADITGAIFRLQGDLADLKPSVLWGYLTMILIVNFPANVTKAKLAA